MKDHKNILPFLVECFDELLKRYSRDDKLRSLKSRARDMPTELNFKGLAYVITMCAARGSRQIMEYSLMSADCRSLLDKATKIRNLGPEEFGYSIYGAIVLMTLKKSGAIVGNSLSDILRETMNNSAINTYAYTYMDWIKRLAEAYID